MGYDRETSEKKFVKMRNVWCMLLKTSELRDFNNQGKLILCFQPEPSMKTFHPFFINRNACFSFVKNYAYSLDASVGLP